MPKYTTSDIRNIAITGAAASGKTTLVETILHKAGAISRLGRVEDGNTTCDYDDLEKELHHSLDTSVVHFDHAGAHINLIDTPGTSDNLGRSISILTAVETAVIMVDAAAGVETVCRRLWRRTGEQGVPRMIVVNKIDHDEVDIAEMIVSIQDSFGSECRAVNLPADGGKRIVDCYGPAAGATDAGDVADYHTQLVDQIVEVDETLMEKYLEQGEVSPEQLVPAFKKAMAEGHLVPICFMSAREDVGVAEIMDIFANLCPCPLETIGKTFTFGTGDDQKEFKPAQDSEKEILAHVFKVSSDPFVGKLSVFRVHQGHIGGDIHPHVDDGKKGIRVAHVLKLMGKDHKEVDQIIAGDIGAVAKVDELHFDAIMHSGEHGPDVHMAKIGLPKPMFGLAIEGTSKGADTKMGDALRKMLAEDPAFEVERVATTGETVMRGAGEQHLRAKLRLLKDRYGVEVDTHPPRVPYKETITSNADGHHRHKKQSGGAGQFGEVFLRVEPLSGSEEGMIDGLLFVDDTFGGSIPKQFLPAIEKGIRRVLTDGAIAGYPMQNIKVSVYDGKHHPVDSKEIAFMTAGRKAFIDAVQKAKPVLLEPFVKMEITVPSDQIGDISSDLSGRRGRIQATDMIAGNQAIVTAEAPLAEVMTYSSHLKSITAGAGTYSMEYSHDERTPPNVQQDVVKQFQPQEDEE